MKHLVFLLLLASLPVQAQELTEREAILLRKIEQLEQRVSELESKAAGVKVSPDTSAPQPAVERARKDDSPGDLSLNFVLDGYYSYNFNHPVDRRNALRAYDYSDNSFSINQAGVIIERPPDISKGRRVGGRLDLMFGQATETLQGSPANEDRPEVYRNLFQAYGTYVAPVGDGLNIDFGKFASSFGIENNYTKDQMNYSRSYWFNFLPYYHMGLRATYPVTSQLNLSYWLTNGTNQTEDFNGFKSHAVLLNYNPSASVSANLNYFSGQEQRETAAGTPRDRSDFIDAYLTWQATDRLTLAAEADYVTSRVGSQAPLQTVTGGAAYLRYKLQPQFSLSTRFSYLNDKDGLFSGRAQSLKEGTITASYDLAEGLEARLEYRRDWSNVDYFSSADLGRFKGQQDTALLGLIWWFGEKRGPW